MAWRYTINQELRFVEVAYVGKTTAQDLKESTSEFITLQKEKGINRFLIDTSEMELAAALVDVYNVPDKQYVEEQADRRGCVAVILPASTKEREAAEFYETVCINRGWDVKNFLERQGAVNWLTLDTPSKKRDPGEGLYPWLICDVKFQNKREEILEKLTAYTLSLRDALKNTKEANERPLLTGHLAAAAEIYALLYLHKDVSAIEDLVKDEISSHGWSLISGEAGEKVASIWQAFIDAIDKNTD